MGKLFEDTKYTTLIAKLKNDGIPMYKRNVMILTNPVPAKKNISINTVTYEWAPPVQNQTLVSQPTFSSCSRQELMGDREAELTRRINLPLVVILCVPLLFLLLKTGNMVPAYSVLPASSCKCGYLSVELLENQGDEVVFNI